MIMLIAGSSAGSEDFTPALMEELGELLIHGITVMPGKPALLAAADAGLGIHAAAQALLLDFVPVARDATIWSSQTPIWKMKRSSFCSTSSALTSSRRRPWQWEAKRYTRRETSLIRFEDPRRIFLSSLLFFCLRYSMQHFKRKSSIRTENGE
jgi:hypothetical protein